jgi:hypothetical protein
MFYATHNRWRYAKKINSYATEITYRNTKPRHPWFCVPLLLPQNAFTSDYIMQTRKTENAYPVDALGGRICAINKTANHGGMVGILI